MILRSLILSASLAVVWASPAPATEYPGPDSRIAWKTYSPETLAVAKRQKKPLFLLISASWCHWCRQYESQSLESPDVAEVLNSRFVPVFVDHDRRPDVVARYPSRGLPVTVILNPQGGHEVTVSGYLSKEQLRTNLAQTLAELSDSAATVEPTSVQAPTTATKLRTAAHRLLEREYDPIYQGLGTGAKLPHPDILQFMLEGSPRDRKRAHDTLRVLSGEAPWLERLGKHSLLDPVEGGYFRYATLRNWSHPHYEKLLGLNADLLRSLLTMARQTQDKAALSWARQTLSYLDRVLLDPETGGYFGSQAADDAYYHLPARERAAQKPPSVDRRHYASSSARMAIALFEAAEGLASQPHRARAVKVSEDLARRVGPDGAIAHDWTRAGASELSGVLDDQAWTALALTEAFKRTGRAEFRAKAVQVLDFVLQRRKAPGGGFTLEDGGTVLVRPNAEVALAFAKGYRALGHERFGAGARHAFLAAMEHDLEAGHAWSAARLIGGASGGR